MPTPAPPSPSPDALASDLSQRAAALVNPASGLANDYLNVFNEIVMLIDLLPQMSNLAEDIAAWSPVAYRDYFVRSTLPGRHGALNAYDRLDPAFRASFDRSAADLARTASRACAGVLALAAQGDTNPQTLAARCTEEAARLRTKLDRISRTVNHGRRRPRIDMQTHVSELFDAA